MDMIRHDYILVSVYVRMYMSEIADIVFNDHSDDASFYNH